MDEFLQPFSDVINQVMALPDESLNTQMIQIMKDAISASFPETIQNSVVKEMIKNFENENLSRGEAENRILTVKEQLADLIDTLSPSAAKREILDSVFGPITKTLEQAYAQYHTYDIQLPIKLDKGAKAPTYAHESDAAADLYALNDMVLAPHSLGNKVPTGVHIALPEKWMAILVPRSSIGMKTGLRLSNSIGIIDQAYHGDVTALYDNVSDSEYTIHAGDRIAQLLVMPSYCFQAQIVDILPESERNEEGFGSTGV